MSLPEISDCAREGWEDCRADAWRDKEVSRCRTTLSNRDTTESHERRNWELELAHSDPDEQSVALLRRGRCEEMYRDDSITKEDGVW